MTTISNTPSQNLTFAQPGGTQGDEQFFVGSGHVSGAPSIEKIAARAGAPISQGGFGLIAQVATGTPAAAVPKAKSQLQAAPDDELSQFESSLRQRIDAKLRAQPLYYSWMPEPVTVGEAFEKLHVTTLHDFLKKITDGDPTARRLGFLPDTRAFFKHEIEAAQAQAAQEVALELVDTQAANKPVAPGSSTLVKDLLQSLGVTSRYELALLRNDPEKMQHLDAAHVAAAMNKAGRGEQSAIEKLTRNLETLNTNTATLVKEGLATGLFNRSVATQNAQFVKDFSARAANKKLAYLRDYLQKQYSSNGPRHSALDNPDILRFVEGSLSAKERAEFSALFWNLKNKAQG